jgi:hypothetical protein
VTWVASSPGHGHDRKAVPIAGWQRHAQVLHVGSFYDLNVLVLHVADVGGPDVAVDHEHDQVSQVSTHLDALDQPVRRIYCATGFAEIRATIRWTK